MENHTPSDCSLADGRLVVGSVDVTCLSSSGTCEIVSIAGFERYLYAVLALISLRFFGFVELLGSVGVYLCCADTV